MSGIDELAVELAEHAFVEIVLGEHAFALAGNAAADDGDRARSRLLGLRASVEGGREPAAAATDANSRTSAACSVPGSRPYHAIFMRSDCKCFFLTTVNRGVGDIAWPARFQDCLS
jgi:hypothetical protein